MEAVLYVVWVQPERYGTAFNATVSYLGQMVTKKGPSIQSVHIVKTGSQPMRSKVMAFSGKVEFKKYPKAVWNSMTKEQQSQVRKL